MPSSNREQLALLGEIDEILRGERIRYWLRGGWAFDFTLGEITRPHDDIDLVTWKRHQSRISRLFVEHGFTPRPTPMPETDAKFEKRGQDIQVLFVVKGLGGAIYTASFTDAPPRWSLDALSEPPRHLHGLTCRAISAKGQLEEKERTPGWLGRPPRPKDLEAMEILRRLLA
jgi:hypothetical protein